MKTHPVLVKHYNAVIEGFISDLKQRGYPQDFDPELVKQFLELTDPNRIKQLENFQDKATK